MSCKNSRLNSSELLIRSNLIIILFDSLAKFHIFGFRTLILHSETAKLIDSICEMHLSLFLNLYRDFMLSELSQNSINVVPATI